MQLVKGHHGLLYSYSLKFKMHPQVPVLPYHSDPGQAPDLMFFMQLKFMFFYPLPLQATPPKLRFFMKLMSALVDFLVLLSVRQKTCTAV